MIIEDVKDVKDKYTQLIELKDELLKRKTRLEELEKEPIIREYVSLKKQHEDDKESVLYNVLELSEDEILEKAINKVLLFRQGIIYICLGEYKYVRFTNANPTFLPITENEEAEYKRYKSIYKDKSRGNELLIEIYNCDKFEEENIVLYPPKGVDAITYFSEIKKLYFDTAIKYGAERALAKILYKRN